MSYTTSYTICCVFPPFLNVVWQDTLCLVAPYPFRMEPLEDFDPLTDFDMTGGDDVWFARPQLFFSCSLCPTGRTEDKCSYREVSLVFFSTFEPISLTPDSCMQRNGIPMLYTISYTEYRIRHRVYIRYRIRYTTCDIVYDIVYDIVGIPHRV